MSSVEHAPMLTPRSVWSMNEELLMPYEYNPSEGGDYTELVRAISLAFGIDDEPLLLRQLCNRDLLWAPEPRSSSRIRTMNAFQYASCGEGGQREPVRSTFSYLFQDREPYYGEPYFCSDELAGSAAAQAEHAAIRRFRERVRANFSTAETYVQRVLTVLFAPQNDVAHWAEIVNKAVVWT